MENQELWMIRSGESGRLARHFVDKKIIAIGWDEVGPLYVTDSHQDIQRKVERAYPDDKKGYLRSTTGQLERFLHMETGKTRILTYDKEARLYYVGRISGDYKYSDSRDEYKHVRQVEWQKMVLRDSLTEDTRYALGGFSTIFQISDEAATEIHQLSQPIELHDNVSVQKEDGSLMSKEEIEEWTRKTVKDILEEMRTPIRNVVDQARTFIDDQIVKLSADDVPRLFAGILQAMGYITKVTSKRDRGRDIVATKDGIGLTGPYIIVEVKHWQKQVGPETMRAFTAVPRQTHKAIFLSTGGFTVEAKYEAERANLPIILLDRNDLVDLLLQHYDKLDQATKQLLPLTKVYWPSNFD